MAYPTTTCICVARRQEDREYYHRVFGAKIVESIQSDGKPAPISTWTADIFIARCAEPRSRRPTEPYVGLITSDCASTTWTTRSPSSSAGPSFKMEPRTSARA